MVGQGRWWIHFLDELVWISSEWWGDPAINIRGWLLRTVDHQRHHRLVNKIHNDLNLDGGIQLPWVTFAAVTWICDCTMKWPHWEKYMNTTCDSKLDKAHKSIYVVKEQGPPKTAIRNQQPAQSPLAICQSNKSTLPINVRQGLAQNFLKWSLPLPLHPLSRRFVPYKLSWGLESQLKPAAKFTYFPLFPFHNFLQFFDSHMPGKGATYVPLMPLLFLVPECPPDLSTMLNQCTCM